MKIDIAKLEEFIPVFVPLIVDAAMSTCEAAALCRPLTEKEIHEIADKVASGTIEYVTDVVNELNKMGAEISDNTASEIAEKAYHRVFENAWVLIQKVTEEIKNRANSS